MSGIDSSLWVKICGLIVPEQAVAIARIGADAIGLIGVQSSPRYVTPLQMRAISHALIEASFDSVERVGVLVNADVKALAEMVDVGKLTTLQLHGQESPETCTAIRQLYPDLKLIKAFRIKSEADLASTQLYENVVDAILLDAYDPQQLGGTGKTLPWRSLQNFQPRQPWILAGGLKPENIQEALASLTPHGIDLSSGVESSPGNKSLPKVKQLFAALQNRSTNSVS
ncbi:MAG: phosphoribosylanthranilate isomerase [Cyanobacteria bacterium J06639_14]